MTKNIQYLPHKLKYRNRWNIFKFYQFSYKNNKMFAKNVVTTLFCSVDWNILTGFIFAKDGEKFVTGPGGHTGVG